MSARGLTPCQFTTAARAGVSVRGLPPCRSAEVVVAEEAQQVLAVHAGEAGGFAGVALRLGDEAGEVGALEVVEGGGAGFLVGGEGGVVRGWRGTGDAFAGGVEL